jgi:CheY-like chemotaxis protein
MNGFEFISHLRAKPEWRSIPVVVLTARDLTEEEHRMLSGHVEGLVRKQGGNIETFVQLVMSVVPKSDQKKAS